MFTLVNVYAPNQGQISMVLALLRKLGPLAEGMIVLGGDLNIIFNSTLDTTSTSRRFSLPQINLLRCRLHDFQLVDRWRLLLPTKRNYTCHSLTYKT